MPTRNLLGLAVLALAACTVGPSAGSPDAASGVAPKSARDPRDARLAALDRMRTAVEARDARALAALYADDAVVEPAGVAPLHGRAAIEAALQAELAPAATMRFGFRRLWLTPEVVIAEGSFRASHPAGSGLRDVGASELAIFWFDAAGRIAREHSYLERGTLRAQAAGEPDAPPIPPLPTSTEVHVARGPADPKVVSWAHAYEAAVSRSDADGLAYLDERIHVDCVLGFHGTSRSELAGPLQAWRTAFPDQKWTATAVWPVGDYVIVEEAFTGTHKGKFGSFDASGKTVSWRWAEVWRVEDARIAHMWSFTNGDEIDTQITGRAPARGSAKVACDLP